MQKVQEYKTGDSVVVKPGVMCPDNPALSLAGFQGRVTEIDSSEGTVAINWDSATLLAIPEDYVRDCEMEGLSWETMVLGTDDLERASSRDRERDSAKATQEIMARHAWDNLADTNSGIQRVLSGIRPDDTMSLLAAWEAYLEESLIFPFDATVEETLFESPIPLGEHVLVSSISVVDLDYGILVNVRYKHQHSLVPLCDLEVSDLDSPNYQPLKDYVVWFANR